MINTYTVRIWEAKEENEIYHLKIWRPTSARCHKTGIATLECLPLAIEFDSELSQQSKVLCKGMVKLAGQRRTVGTAH